MKVTYFLLLACNVVGAAVDSRAALQARLERQVAAVPVVANGDAVPEDEALLGLFGGPFLNDRARVISSSPVTYATADDPPFLTFHATKDERVDFRHAKRIHDTLTRVGVSSLVIPILNGRHHIDQPEVTEIIDQFLARHLRGLPVRVPSDPVDAPERP